MWAIGCIFAELVWDKALFEGESEVEQLFKIFRFIGKPNSNLNDVILPVENLIKLPSWQPVIFTDVCYDWNSFEFQRIISACVPGREEVIQTLM